jgi:hypothetical protein
VFVEHGVEFTIARTGRNEDHLRDKLDLRGGSALDEKQLAEAISGATIRALCTEHPCARECSSSKYAFRSMVRRL